YLVQTSKTPGGRVMTVLERRPRRFSFATAPPITPASRVSRPQTTMKEEQKEVYQLVVMVDKWGRGIELISLVNDVEVPTSKTTAEEKSRYAMELVLQHMEKMTEQKVFIHGVIDEKLSEEKHRLICGSENMEAEIFSEVRLELKLEMMAPEHLLMSVFTARVQPTIEQPNPIAMPTRGSELVVSSC
uniref:Uncharacterized protein n=1 Tax=Caenorhabditis japonica TaxID=281687 RepID=A0A8R1IXN8_CAEJA